MKKVKTNYLVNSLKIALKIIEAEYLDEKYLVNALKIALKIIEAEYLDEKYDGESEVIRDAIRRFER